LPEKALLKVLFHLSTEDVLNLSQTCQAHHHVLVHGLKCLHFAAYLASQKELLWIKLKLLLDVARISPRDIIKATNISALLHYTVAISYLRALPEKSTIFLKLKTQLQKHIPNGPLFKQALQISTELLDPAWESYANWFLTLGAEGTRCRELLNRLEIRTIVPSLEQSLCEEKPYSLIVHFRPLFPSSQGGLDLMESFSEDLKLFSDQPLQILSMPSSWLDSSLIKEEQTYL
jgi:hypothetical protein